MSQAITIIVDDQDENINYLCPVVKQTVAGTYINNTWTAVENAECGSGGWFKYTFSGEFRSSRKFNMTSFSSGKRPIYSTWLVDRNKNSSCCSLFLAQ